MIFGLRSIFSLNSLATEDDDSSTARDNNGFLHSRGVPNFPSSTFERLDFSDLAYMSSAARSCKPSKWNGECIF